MGRLRHQIAYAQERLASEKSLEINDQDDWAHYKLMHNQVTSEIRKAKKYIAFEFCRSICTKANMQSAKLCKTISHQDTSAGTLDGLVQG